MSSQTSAPYPTTAGVARRSKCEMMRQWRGRALAAQWVPGLFGLLWGLAVLLDLALVAGAVLLVSPRCLPRGVREALPGPLAGASGLWGPGAGALGLCGPVAGASGLCERAGPGDSFTATAGFMGDSERHRWLENYQPLRKAWLFSLSATLFAAGFLAVGRPVRPAGWLSYALSWSGLLLAGFWSGLAVLYRASLIGPSPLSSFNEWLLWVGFLAVVLGLVGELATRRGWVGFAAALVAGLGLLAAEWWPVPWYDTTQPVYGVLCSRCGLMLPGLTLVAAYAALGLAWALGGCNLVLTLVAPGRPEPAATLSRFACRWLQIGITLLASAALLDGSWGGDAGSSLWNWQPGDVWALSPLACAVLVLLARHHGWLGNLGVAAWSVFGFSALVCLWAGWHYRPGACAWTCWGGLLGCALAVHAALRHLFWRPA